MVGGPRADAGCMSSVKAEEGGRREDFRSNAGGKTSRCRYVGRSMTGSGGEEGAIITTSRGSKDAGGEGEKDGAGGW